MTTSVAGMLLAYYSIEWCHPISERSWYHKLVVRTMGYISGPDKLTLFERCHRNQRISIQTLLMDFSTMLFPIVQSSHIRAVTDLRQCKRKETLIITRSSSF